MTQIIELECPGCGRPLSSDMQACPACNRPVVISSFNSVYYIRSALPTDVMCKGL